jgi:hypothetical protein
MRTGGSRPSGRTRDLPVSDAVPLHVMCSSTPAGRLVPRIAALLVLRSTTTTASAPAMRQFRGSIDTPCNCCVRFVAIVTEAHATLTTERPATAFSGRSFTGWTAPAILAPSVVVAKPVVIADLKDRLSDWKPYAGSAKAEEVMRKLLRALAATPRKRSSHGFSASARTRCGCLMGRPRREWVPRSVSSSFGLAERRKASLALILGQGCRPICVPCLLEREESIA